MKGGEKCISGRKRFWRQSLLAYELKGYLQCKSKDKNGGAKMARREPRKVARILAGLAKVNKKEHYRIRRVDLIKLTGRKTISDDLLVQIRERAHERGYILVDLGEGFAVLEARPMERYRRFSWEAISKYIRKSKEGVGEKASSEVAKRGLRNDREDRE